MNDVRTPIVVCFYRGRVGTDLSVLWVACWSVFVLFFLKIYIIQQQL
jgi:hypothetical protein